jgi:hypothetical protein
MNAPRQVTQYSGGILRFDDGTVSKVDASGNVPQARFPSSQVNLVKGAESAEKLAQQQAAAKQKAEEEAAAAAEKQAAADKLAEEHAAAAKAADDAEKAKQAEADAMAAKAKGTGSDNTPPVKGADTSGTTGAKA